MVSAEIAVAMAVQIENPAECEVRGVISLLQSGEISGYLAEETSSRVELHVRILPGRHKSNSIDTSSVQFGPDTSDFFLFPKMKTYLSDKRLANDEDLKDAVMV